MKIITTLLLTLFTLSGIAQEPRLTYTKEYHDNVVDSIISQYEAIIPNLAIIDTIDIWKDDIYFRVRDGRLDIELRKEGHDVLVLIGDGLYRFRMNFVDDELVYFIGHDNYGEFPFRFDVNCIKP